MPGWKTLPSVVGSSDRCVCAVPIQAQEKKQEPEQDHRLGQQFQWDLQIHIGPKFLVWFPCVVKLRCLSFHWFVCFYYCLFVKTQGEHPSTQYLLGQRPWGPCAYIENMYIYCASSVCWTWRLLSSPLGGLCCTQRILVFAQTKSPQVLSARKKREGFYLAEGSCEDIVSLCTYVNISGISWIIILHTHNAI